MPTWSELKAKRRNPRESVPLVMDTAAADEAKLLAASWDSTPEPERLTLATRIDAAERAARESIVVFTFEAVGRGAHELLVAEHPPTKDQLSGMPDDTTLRWNPQTFPPALAAASCVEPAEIAGDVDEWAEIHRTWSDGQWRALWSACMMAQGVAVSDAPKSRAASDALSRSGRR